MIFVGCDMDEDFRAAGRGPLHEIDVHAWPLDACVCEKIVKRAHRDLMNDMYEAWVDEVKRIGDTYGVDVVTQCGGAGEDDAAARWISRAARDAISEEMEEASTRAVEETIEQLRREATPGRR